MVFSQNLAKFFKKKFGIDQIPSKPTFSRILNMMDGDAVAAVIIEIMKEKAKFMSNMTNILAVDGKAIRSTTEKGKPNWALQILTAYLTGTGVVLGQKDIHEKTNEIPVFQEMLGYLDIRPVLKLQISGQNNPLKPVLFCPQAVVLGQVY